jgi:hypothetical protein
MAFERDAEGDGPEPAGGDTGGLVCVPSVACHLAGIGSRTLDKQSLDGARDLGHQVRPLACKDQRLDEQGKAVSSHDTIDERARVGLRGARTGRLWLLKT